MSTRRSGIILAVALLALTACSGGGDDETAAPVPETVTVASDSASPPGAMTLRDTCPEFEKALPDGMLPGVRALEDFASRMADLYEQATLRRKTRWT